MGAESRVGDAVPAEWRSDEPLLERPVRVDDPVLGARIIGQVAVHVAKAAYPEVRPPTSAPS